MYPLWPQLWLVGVLELHFSSFLLGNPLISCYSAVAVMNYCKSRCWLLFLGYNLIDSSFTCRKGLMGVFLDSSAPGSSLKTMTWYIISCKGSVFWLIQKKSILRLVARGKSSSRFHFSTYFRVRGSFSFLSQCLFAKSRDNLIHWLTKWETFYKA